MGGREGRRSVWQSTFFFTLQASIASFVPIVRVNTKQPEPTVGAVDTRFAGLLVTTTHPALAESSSSRERGTGNP